MIICDETIIKLMRTHHKHAKLHSCLNKLNLTLNIMCFLVVRNVDTDISLLSRSPATEYSFFC